MAQNEKNECFLLSSTLKVLEDKVNLGLAKITKNKVEGNKVHFFPFGHFGGDIANFLFSFKGGLLLYPQIKKRIVPTNGPKVVMCCP